MMHRSSAQGFAKMLTGMVGGGLAFLALIALLGLSLAAPATGYAQTTGPTPTAVPTAPPVGEPNLVLTKSVNQSPVTVGGLAIFTIVVTNNGTADATDVVLRDPVPGQFQVQSASSTKGNVSITGQVVTVEIGTMAPGEVVTITITTRAMVETNGPVRNVARATYSGTRGAQAAAIEASVDALIVRVKLPQSGEPLLLWPLAGAAMLALVVAGGWMLRRSASAK